MRDISDFYMDDDSNERDEKLKKTFPNVSKQNVCQVVGAFPKKNFYFG